jgi:hypothetical protein
VLNSNSSEYVVSLDPKEYNREPFPIKNCVAIEKVSSDDPRVGLRGGKKAVAMSNIEANQIVGIYEGAIRDKLITQARITSNASMIWTEQS